MGGRFRILILLSASCFGCPRPVALDLSSLRPTTEDHQPDYLVPLDAPLGTYEPSAYRATLHDCLLVHPYRWAQMVSTPSFEVESAVYLTTEDSDEEAWAVVYREMKSSLWSAGDFGSVTSTPAGGCEGIFSGIRSADSPHVREHRRGVRKETADALKRTWRIALNQARFPTSEGGRGEDGTTYAFADFQRHVGYRHGAAWSPREGSRMGALVHLAGVLTHLARAKTDAEAAALENEVREEAAIVAGKLRATPDER